MKRLIFSVQGQPLKISRLHAIRWQRSMTWLTPTKMTARHSIWLALFVGLWRISWWCSHWWCLEISERSHERGHGGQNKSSQSKRWYLNPKWCIYVLLTHFFVFFVHDGCSLSCIYSAVQLLVKNAFLFVCYSPDWIHKFLLGLFNHRLDQSRLSSSPNLSDKSGISSRALTNASVCFS